MSEENKNNLEEIGEPDRVEIIPGLVLEDKLRIKTQRRLEKQFGLPIVQIFPGKMKDPVTKKIEKWDGVDFNFMNNSIPLLTILARQVNDEITEGYIEELLDDLDDETILAKNLEVYFKRIRPKKPKNFRRPNRKKRRKK